MNDEKPLFQGMDEQERTYAPEQLPSDDPMKRVIGEQDPETTAAIRAENYKPLRPRPRGERR